MTVSLTSVNIGGVNIAALTPFAWSLTSGVQPYQRFVDLPPDQAKTIYEAGDELTITLKAIGRTVEIKPVYVVKSESGDRPDTTRLLLTDLRYRWRSKWVARSYNVRRRTGSLRLYEDGGGLETAVTIPDIYYAPWSLNNGSPWTAKELLDDVLSAVVDGPVSVAQGLSGIIVEGVEIDAPGDVAIQQALAYVPGAEITVDPDGTTRVYDARDQSEVQQLATAGPVLVGSGYAGLVDRSRFRPSRYRILFEREVEVRFDFEEETSTIDPDARRLDNVVSVPDPTIDVPARGSAAAGGVIVSGTYINIIDYIEAVNQLGPGEEITFEALRKMFAQQQLYEQKISIDKNTAQYDIEWGRRIAAIWQHWRRVFQIPRGWMDRIRSIRDYRVAIVDKETGIRAPAAIYAEYQRRPTYLGFFRKNTKQNDFDYVVGKAPTTDTDPLANAQRAPAVLQIIDEDQGIFHVIPIPDVHGSTAAMTPGSLDESVVQSPKDVLGRRLVWFGGTLKAAWRMAVVLTVIQGSPNTTKRYHSVYEAGSGTGPTATIKVPANVLTAKFGWQDASAFEIEGAFLSGTDLPASLLVNRRNVETLAAGVAARQESELRDRVEGVFSVPLQPVAKCGGTISSVTHTVNSAGVAATSYVMPPVVGQSSIWDSVPADIQAAIRRTAQP